MRHVQPPLHLLTVTILCVVSLVTLIILRNRIIRGGYKLLFISAVIFVLIYLYFVGSALFEDMYCQWDVNKYDLNQDGVFSGNEIDPYQVAAMKRLTNDTARNFSIVTGLVASFIISLLVYGTGWSYKRFWK